MRFLPRPTVPFHIMDCYPRSKAFHARRAALPSRATASAVLAMSGRAHYMDRG